MDSMIEEWSNDWFCYWDGSYGMPADENKDFVFRPALAWVEGVVVSADAMPSMDDDDVKAAREQLCRFQGQLGEAGVMCSEAGSESENPYQAILITVPQGQELTPGLILSRLGAHEQLLNSIEEYAPAAERREVMFGDSTADIFAFLSRNNVSPLLFYCGSDKLNPVPFFVVGQLGDGLVGGFISGIIHT